MNLSDIDKVIERAYVPGILAEARRERALYDAVGCPFPPEPVGLTDLELATWYLDLHYEGLRPRMVPRKRRRARR